MVRFVLLKNPLNIFFHKEYIHELSQEGGIFVENFIGKLIGYSFDENKCRSYYTVYYYYNNNLKCSEIYDFKINISKKDTSGLFCIYNNKIELKELFSEKKELRIDISFDDYNKKDLEFKNFYNKNIDWIEK